MKILFASDIHGSMHYAKILEDIIKREEPDYIALLGDLLYHGARNPLTEDYSPKGVTEILNRYKDKIVAVRGNCDSEVDKMVLDFDIMADYTIVLAGRRKLFLTHGHIYNVENPPTLMERDVLIFGHTHIPLAEKSSDYYVFNPGSITLPKENNPNSYGVYEDEVIYVRELDGKEMLKLELE